MAPTCPHGLPPSECLICPTLPQAAAGQPAPVRRPRGGTIHVAGVVVAIAVIGLVAWAVAGIVFAVLHVLELAAVALAAGWAGYRLGHYRGGRPRR